MGRSGSLKTTHFFIRKVWVPVMSFCESVLTLQSALESEQEARIVQINFSAAFNRVNHQVILNQLCSVGIGGCVLSILPQSLLWWMACYGGWLSK